MKQLPDLHERMRAHHLTRARAATTPERRSYHLLLAAAIRKPDFYHHPEFEPDWRDARARWCARMRLASFTHQAIHTTW
jgi:hypothetical protein